MSSAFHRLAAASLMSVALFALTILAGPGLAFGAPNDGPVPTFSCAVANGDATFTYFFGYTLAGTDTVNIPVGSDNRVTPGNNPQNQPTQFLPGTRSAFSLTTSDRQVKWHLGSTNLDVDSAMLCSTPPVVSEAARRIALPVAVALPFSLWFLANRRRARRLTIG